MAKQAANYEQESLLGELLNDRPKAAGGRAVTRPPSTPRRTSALAVRLDWISADAVEVIFNVFLLALIGGGVIASIIGTFYGIRVEMVPVAVDSASGAKTIDVGRIWTDLVAMPGAAFGAVLAQLFLSVFQLRFSSAMLDALRDADPRWWRFLIAYALALFGSFYFNCQAYWQPAITMGWNAVFLFVVLIVADMAPELMISRKA